MESGTPTTDLVQSDGLPLIHLITHFLEHALKRIMNSLWHLLNRRMIEAGKTPSSIRRPLDDLSSPTIPLVGEGNQQNLEALSMRNARIRFLCLGNQTP